MARVVPRFLYDNAVAKPATLLAASSADPGFPVAWLRDPLRSKVWRSRLGWNVVAGRNDKLDVSEGGISRVATLAPGNYATGAAYAAAVEAALDSMGGVNGYRCLYDAGTARFTVQRESGVASVTLRWASGGNAATSVGKDLGFDVSADDSGLTSYLADFTSYHSREWLRADLQSALSPQAGIVINHNAGAGGTFSLRANSADAWSAPPFSQVLSGDALLRLSFFSSFPYRYWELLIEDVQNPAGYSEVGLLFVGTYAEPSWGYAPSFAKRVGELSNVDFADRGAHYHDSRPRRRVWSLPWQVVSDANRQVLESVAAACPRGRSLFLALDAQSPLETYYGFFQDELEVHNVPTAAGRYWNVSGMTFAEALG